MNKILWNFLKAGQNEEPEKWNINTALLVTFQLIENSVYWADV